MVSIPIIFFSHFLHRLLGCSEEKIRPVLVMLSVGLLKGTEKRASFLPPCCITEVRVFVNFGVML